MNPSAPKTERNRAMYDALLAGRSYADIAREHNLSRMTVQLICAKEAKRRALLPPERWTLDSLIAETTLPLRVRNIFEEARTTFGDVLDVRAADNGDWPAVLFRLHNFGRKAYLDLKDAMASRGWMI